MKFDYPVYADNKEVLIIGLLYLVFSSSNLSNLQYAIAISNNDVKNILDKGNVAEIFDFGSGIFAAILFALSLIAYRNLKSKRLLYVSLAFGIFAIRAIVLRLELFMPDIESSLLELLLAIMGFAALGLFFLAIVRREKIRTKTTHA